MKRFIGRLANYLLYAGVDKEKANQVMDDVDRDNRRSLSVYLNLAVLYFFISFVASFFLEGIHGNMVVYAFGCTGAAVMLVVLEVVKARTHFSVITLIFGFQALMIVLGLYSSLVTYPDEKTVMLIFFSILLPMIFTVYPWGFMIIDIIFLTVYGVLSARLKPPEILGNDFINVFFFSTLGFVCSISLTHSKFERYIFAKDAERLMKAELSMKEAELKSAGLANRVSQVKPHFVYNCLTTIASLCDTDPAKAKQVTIDFSKYLRTNLNVVDDNVPIPFSEELSHIKAYLRIEKERFEELLDVKYDIKEDSFRVPKLSVQPLVENAVKHGVGQKMEGGTVTISTASDDKNYYIYVIDDGVGFDAMVEIPEGHYGIDSVKKRIELQCNGRMVIESRVDEGTKITLIIPRENSDGNILD